MIPWQPVVTLIAIGVPIAAMAGIALVVWSRTGPLRHGRVADERWPWDHVVVRTSRLTLVPAVGGVVVAAAGVAVAIGEAVGSGRGLRGPPVALAASGTIIAWAGWSGRVVELGPRPDGFSVHYRRRRPFHVPRDSLVRVAPPRWPLGGWRLTVRFGDRTDRRTLMPSDVIGREWVLQAAVTMAGLTFERRAWTATTERPASRSSAGDGRRSGRSTSREEVRRTRSPSSPDR